MKHIMNITAKLTDSLQKQKDEDPIAFALR